MSTWKFGCAGLGLAIIVGNVAPAAAADEAWIVAARKEGRVVWYTALAVDQLARPASEAFEKHYGIKVNYARADSTDIAVRILGEARAGRVQADVFDGTATVAGLKREGVVMKWVPDIARTMPPDFVDPEGYWVATSLYFQTPNVNTKLVPAGGEPRVWSDLLDSKWKGKIVFGASPSTSGGAGFIGHMLTVMGEEKGMEFIRAFAGQNVASLGVAARQILDQVIAGEYAIALNISNNNAVISSAKGAPVKWLPMQPVMGVFSAVSLTKDAPHPNAAKRFVDYLMTDEGQAIYRDADYIPVDPNVPPRDPSTKPDGVYAKAVYCPPEKIDGSMGKWVEIYKQYFR